MKKILNLLLLCFMLFSSSNLLAQTDWHLGGNTLSSSQRLGTNNNYSIIFETNNSDRGRITGGGNWGIGTTDPIAKLHVNTTVSGQTPFRVHVLGSTKLLMNSAGNLGIGTTAPFRKFQVQDGDMRISRTASAPRFFEFVSTVTDQNDVRLEHSSTGGSLYFSSSSDNFANFTDLARFDLTTSPTYVFTVMGDALASGGIWQDSDLKLKKEINNFKSAMDVVDKLQAKTYFFKTDGYNKLNLPVSKQYGFIAQDVEKILPELVKTSLQPVGVNVNGERQMEEVKAVNYTGFVPILAEALKEQKQTVLEQQQTILEQQKIISTLQERIVKVEAAINAISIINKNTDISNKEISGMSLKLAPNPAKGYTNIQYKINKEANAQFIVHNSQGQIVKTIQAPTNGQLQLNTHDFIAGTYIITLIVDQEIAESTKMVVENK